MSFQAAGFIVCCTVKDKCDVFLNEASGNVRKCLKRTLRFYFDSRLYSRVTVGRQTGLVVKVLASEGLSVAFVLTHFA